jgi:prevent-host-death family protein
VTKNVTIEDLVEHIAEHVAAARDGTPIDIVEDGRRVAALLPAEADRSVERLARPGDFVPGARPPRLDFDAVDWLIYDRRNARF